MTSQWGCTLHICLSYSCDSMLYTIVYETRVVCALSLERPGVWEWLSQYTGPTFIPFSIFCLWASPLGGSTITLSLSLSLSTPSVGVVELPFLYCWLEQQCTAVGDLGANHSTTLPAHRRTLFLMSAFFQDLMLTGSCCYVISYWLNAVLIDFILSVYMLKVNLFTVKYVLSKVVYTQIINALSQSQAIS